MLKKISLSIISLTLLIYSSFSLYHYYSNNTQSNNFQNHNKLFNIQENDIFLGNPNSTVKIITYSSLTCSACKYYHSNIFNKLKTNYIDNNKILYISREFPFDNRAYLASILTRCAPKQLFYPLLSSLFENQHIWAFTQNYKTILTHIASSAGISSEQFEICINDTNIQNIIINNNIDAKQTLNLSAAPTIFINGQQIDPHITHNYQLFAHKIDQLLLQK